ncbi:TPM domain-containing protein [Gallibacterium melopsittaci]|uniref:TPM domain-containing protein n=1 Tax=Gallibacterium melopsittaci TaxID=516063 RepID=A0ABV6HYL9_9PAST
MKKYAYVLWFCLFFSTVSGAANFPSVPQPFHYLNDYTHTLSEQQQQAIEQQLVNYSQKTSSQIAVVMIPTTGEMEIADYTFALGDRWGIGRKKLNNGVLMLIAKNDRKVFIATGQGLEGVLPDAFLGKVIRQVITPAFRENRYATGISEGLKYIMAASQGEFKPEQLAEPERYDFIPVLMVAFFFLVVFLSERHKRRTYISPRSRHYQSGGIYINLDDNPFERHHRGGFGGGDRGGFGGGSFGGGGAGGSW